MNRFLLVVSCAGILLLASSSAADVGFGYILEVESANGDTPVSLYCLPDGNGHGFNECFIYGDIGPNCDATISIRLLDEEGIPLANWPAEDIWLETDDLMVIACPGGTCVDAPTDSDGRTVFREPLFAGGHSNPPQDNLYARMDSYLLWETPLNIYINSPDINGDLVVNLTDAAIFAGMYFDPGINPYPVDFFWDGAINISDLVMFAQGFGAYCP